MHLSYLRDFTVFAQYMNISKAAFELNMTQSNLSRHIRQIEIEIGVELLSRGNRVTLTPAGLFFLDKVKVIIDSFDEVAAEARAIEAESMEPLVIRKPTWPDIASVHLYRCIERFHTNQPNTPVRFVQKKYLHPIEMIRSRSVDAHIIYEYGDVQDIINRYERLGFVAYPLCTDRFAVWCHKDSALAKKGHLSPDDLCGVPIFETNQLYKPLESAITGLCSSHGFVPTFEYKTIDSFQEMLLTHSSTSIHVFPESVGNDIQLKVNESMVLLPIEGDSAVMQIVLIVECNCEKNSVNSFCEVMTEAGRPSG